MMVSLMVGGPVGCAPDAPASQEERATGAESHIWPPLAEEAEGAREERGDNPWLNGTIAAPGSGGLGGGSGEIEDPHHKGEIAAAGAGNGSTDGGTLPVDDLPEDKPVSLLRRFVRYAEGFGSDKILGIWGEAGTSDVECQVEIYTNGSSEPRRKLTLVPTFPASQEVLLCSPAAWTDSCTHEMSGSLYNGNDAFVLRCGDVILDSLGTVGEDPGDGWSREGDEGSVSTQNQTLVRCGTSVDFDPFDPTTLLDWVRHGEEPLEDALERCPSTETGMGGAFGSTHS